MLPTISSAWGHIRLPARRILILIIGVVAFILLSYILMEHLSRPETLPGPYSRKDIERICSSSGGERIGSDNFDKYQPGSKDSWVEEEEESHWYGDDEDLVREYEKSGKMVDPQRLLLGPPTPHFKGNLRPELKYITGWYDGEFTNQFMGITNLLFISKITPHHIPVLPPFMARPHLPVRAGWKHVSTIFDLDRWARSIDKHIVEWKDVKDTSKGRKTADQGPMADEEDQMGCWSVWAETSKERKPYTGSLLPEYLNLDISYTPIPHEARLLPNSYGDPHVSFSGLSMLAHASPENPNPLSSETLKRIHPSPKNNVVLSPDSHLTCFDFLYWLGSGHGFDWEMSYSSAWNLVGKYARWSDRIRSLARTSLSLTLEMKKRDVMRPGPGDQDWRDDRDGRKFHPHDLKALEERDEVRVTFISIHAGHGDFLADCPRKQQKGLPCYPSLGKYDELVIEIENELKRMGRLHPDEGRLPVIMTSDETDEEWWDLVAVMGWKRIIFPEELAIPPALNLRNVPVEEDWGAEVYEKLWRRMLVEIALQGFGTGFIGTSSNTMSLVAARRVEHWQGGVTRMVKFAISGDP